MSSQQRRAPTTTYRAEPRVPVPDEFWNTILAQKIHFSCRCRIWRTRLKSRFCLVRHGRAEWSCDPPTHIHTRARAHARDLPRDLWRAIDAANPFRYYVFIHMCVLLQRWIRVHSSMPTFLIILFFKCILLQYQNFYFWKIGLAAVFFSHQLQMSNQKISTRFPSCVITFSLLYKLNYITKTKL